MEGVFKMRSLVGVARAAKEREEVNRSVQSYSDQMLNDVVVKEYLRFLPALSHYHVQKRVEALRGDSKGAKNESALRRTDDDVHFVENHWIAALFLDISGFTRLSQALGAEKTKYHCNKFFTMILKVIAMFRGDTLKFLGDAMFVLWPLEKHASAKEQSMACHAAAECAAAIMAVGNYDAEDTHQETHEVFHVKLRLHCGLACGKITFFHLGNADRTEAIMGGDPIPQLAKCEAQAEQGQVVMSPEFFTLLPQDSLAAKTSTHAGKNYLLHWERMTQAPAQASKSGASISRRISVSEATRRVAHVLDSVTVCNDSLHKQFGTSRQRAKKMGVARNSQRSIARWRRDRLRMLNAVRHESEDDDSGGKKLLAPALIRRNIRSLVHEVARRAVDEDMVEIIGDMNLVTTMFVRLDQLIPHISSGNLDMVQQAFMILVDCAKEAGGVVRQFVQDDKGCVGINAFGVSGYSFIDNEARAIRCAFAVLERFRKLDIHCSIGIATGNVFCGLVGSMHRCEWAMLGPSVNLAARLMGKARPGYVLVEDEAWRQAVASTDEFEFDHLDPVKAKGYADLVPVHRPRQVQRLRRVASAGDATKTNARDDVGSLNKTQSEINEKRELLRMKRLHTLDIFSHLVLKIAAVITFSHKETQCTKVQPPEHCRPRSESVFTLSQLMFALTALGHGSDLNKLQDALSVLCESDGLPGLICSAAPSKAQRARKQSYVETGSTKVTDSSSMSAAAKDLVTRTLKSHFLFASKSPSKIDDIVMSMRPLTMKKGEYLFNQGDPSDVYYILGKGQLTLIVDGLEAKTFAPGVGFGELSMLYNTPRTASILVSGEPDTCTLWCMDRHDFLKHVDMEYTFANGDIRRKVYGQILSKHRLEMHSIVAMFLLNQRRSRQELKGRFKNVVRKLIGLSRWNKKGAMAVARKEIEEEEETDDMPGKLNISTKGDASSGTPATRGSESYGDESFDAGGGMQIRVCQHLLYSDVEVSVAVEHFQRLADAAIEHDDTALILEWHSYLLGLAFGTEVMNMQSILGIFWKPEGITRKTSFLNASVHPKSKKKPIQQRASFHMKVTKMEAQIMDDTNLSAAKIEPRKGVPRDSDGKKSMRKTMSHDMSERSIQSSSSPRSQDDIEERTRARAAIGPVDVGRWLVTLSKAYKETGHHTAGFNAAQVALLYSGFPTVPAPMKRSYVMNKYIRPMLFRRSIKKQFKEQTPDKIELARDAYAALSKCLIAYFANSFGDESDATEMNRMVDAADFVNAANETVSALFTAARIAHAFKRPGSTESSREEAGSSASEKSTKKPPVVSPGVSKQKNKSSRLVSAARRLVLFRRN